MKPRSSFVLAFLFGCGAALWGAGNVLATDVGLNEHPIGASPLRAPFVPAFKPCSLVSSNASHEPTLPGRSCSPEVPGSGIAAVGPESLGFVRFVVLQPGQCAKFDSTHCYPDFTVEVSVTDVRAGGPTGPPFSGLLTGHARLPSLSGSAPFAVQVTDATGTVVPLPFPVPINCTSGTCSAQTTGNTVVPGLATGGKRTVIEIGQLQIVDQNGDSFESQGYFLP